MGARLSTHSRYLAVVLALAAVAVLAVVSPASAHSPGTGAWYWPVGAEKFEYSGWWDNRGYCWHLAQDMEAAYGRPVYAIADGLVLESRYIRGYGPGGSEGGVIVVLHKTYQGKPFKALYGHVSKMRYDKGDQVKAGAVIAAINGSHPSHLHFGIHPGAEYPSDNNPFRGHTYTSKNTYGWVDPVRFLRTHYRVDPYRAPALELVGSVDTTESPLWASASSGRLYWAESEESTPTTWTCTLPSGRPRPTETSETIPPHDGARYQLTVGPDDEDRIIVRDRLPRLTLSSDQTRPASGSVVRLSGVLRNSADKPFVHAWVRVERWDGARWVGVGGRYTSETGWWSLRYRPAGRTILRARFYPPRTYSTGTSNLVRIYVR